MSDEKFSIGELEKILKKVELLEKIGIRLKWKEILADDGNFGVNLVRDLKDEIAQLSKKIAARGEIGGVHVLVRPDPVPVEGWGVRELDDDAVEYSKNGEVWIWQRSKRKWIAPKNHPDPNPITPEGKRLGPGM